MGVVAFRQSAAGFRQPSQRRSDETPLLGSWKVARMPLGRYLLGMVQESSPPAGQPATRAQLQATSHQRRAGAHYAIGNGEELQLTLFPPGAVWRDSSIEKQETPSFIVSNG